VHIYRIAVLAGDIEDVYDGLKKALDYLDQDYVGKVRNEIKKAIKGLEKVRPHLKDKDKPTPSGFMRKK
jgi:molecular chaperone GrpE (heat shock protein)